MTLIISGILMLAGSFFALIASIGVLRLPDLLIRMHSSTKAATVGIGLIFASAAVYFHTVDTTTRILVGIFFLVLTAPIGTHLIARSAYFMRVPLWKETIVDELREAEDAQYCDGIFN